VVKDTGSPVRGWRPTYHTVHSDRRDVVAHRA